jgi:hypothetical protein
MGYHELKRCFGNGFVTCSFVFENEQKVHLEVVTKGKEVKGSPKYKARVENWDLKGLMNHDDDSKKSPSKDWKKPF